MASLFLSYRREDSQEVVGRMYDRLKSHFPVERIFRDLDSVPVGNPFREVIRDALVNSKVAFIVIGPTWTTVTDTTDRRRLKDPADVVRIEVELALSSGILVVPVLVSGAQMPLAEELPTSLRPLVVLNAIQVRPDPDFHRDMDRLIGKVSHLLPAAKAPDNVAVTLGSSESTQPETPLVRNWERTIEAHLVSSMYEVVETIDRTSGGVILLANHQTLYGTTIIKAVNAPKVDDRGLIRLCREGRELQRLRHPNILAIYDVSHNDGVIYVVMQYLSGSKDLAAAYTSGELSLEKLVPIMAKVADGLHFAHSLAFFHGNLTPRMIRMDSGGKPWIAGFGVRMLKRHIDSGESKQAQFGTPPYMSEEQVRLSRRLTSSVHADIRGIGAVLYELWTGEQLNPPHSLSRLHRFLVDGKGPDKLLSAVASRSRNRSFARALVDIIRKCISEKHDDQYQSMKVLANDLYDLMHSQTT